MKCKKCTQVEMVTHYLWDDLADVVTETFGEREIRFEEVRDLIASDPRHVEWVKLLARLTGTTYGNVLMTVASYCQLITPKDEYDAIIDAELVEMGKLVSSRKVGVA